MATIRKAQGAATPVYIVDEQQNLNINYLYFVGSVSSIGESTLIVNASATQRIVVTNVLIQRNDPTEENVIITLKSDTLDFISFVAKNETDGLLLNLNLQTAFKTLAGEDLLIDLSSEISTLVSVQYYLE
jgi:hypothetical protein